jgi:hypothetical protein
VDLGRRLHGHRHGDLVDDRAEHRAGRYRRPRRRRHSGHGSSPATSWRSPARSCPPAQQATATGYGRPADRGCPFSQLPRCFVMPATLSLLTVAYPKGDTATGEFLSRWGPGVRLTRRGARSVQTRRPVGRSAGRRQSDGVPRRDAVVTAGDGDHHRRHRGPHRGMVARSRWKAAPRDSCTHVTPLTDELGGAVANHHDRGVRAAAGD